VRGYLPAARLTRRRSIRGFEEFDWVARGVVEQNLFASDSADMSLRKWVPAARSCSTVAARSAT
jgi:hypothetical protein